MSDLEPVLEIRNLEKSFTQSTGVIRQFLGRDPDKIHAVDQVSLEVPENEAVGVIGESGCGKTTLLETLVHLYKPTGGEIYYRGDRVGDFNSKEMKEYRRNVQLIFQDPFNSLDPKLTVEETLREPLKIHKMGEREERVQTMLQEVKLEPVDRYLHKFPHELSGGEKQRVAIARALVVEPDILLADEPVSMLDVSTQAYVLDLLSNLVDDLGLSLLYISHDISTVAHICNIINVMYLGRIVERGPTAELIQDPKHPYSNALIDAVPIPDPYVKRKRVQLEGSTEDAAGLRDGCRFRDRCPERMEVCEKRPRFVYLDDERRTACHLHYDHDVEDAAEEADRGPDAPESSEVSL